MEENKDYKALLKTVKKECLQVKDNIKAVNKSIVEVKQRYDKVDKIIDDLDITIYKLEKEISAAVEQYAKGEIQESAVDTLKQNLLIAKGKKKTNSTALTLMAEDLKKYEEENRALLATLGEKEEICWECISELELEKLTPILQRAWFSADKGLYRRSSTYGRGYNSYDFMESLQKKVLFIKNIEDVLQKAEKDLTREYLQS
ncbi:MAG: hypothetical protein CXR31_04500 [Geobacter sp.]|nr:MAG: hypothetical protein CXR31_04500 [Geobacter sp.]